ncbi:hypothetical protein LSH36_98g01058 [Paralvinella palmiformis]|uniref:Uncharacterized protein n=1 Tax=Paralvinella palmiformis TaxID=53620 RepID=A0AAD9K0E3_9ANNE|nr:hypothetical protein LSH36_98g01058 [Paralvinella palmiformis]
MAKQQKKISMFSPRPNSISEIVTNQGHESRISSSPNDRPASLPGIVIQNHRPLPDGIRKNSLAMKLPEEAAPAPPSGEALPRRRSSSVDLDAVELSSGSWPEKFRARSSSLDVTSLKQFKSSSNWLQLFVRRSSTDFSIGDTMSPATSFESIASCADSEPRSRHASGDVDAQPANHSGGLVGAQPEQHRPLLARGKSESSLWNWKLFSSKLDDGQRIRKISEMDESDSGVKNTQMPTLATSSGATSHSPSGLFNMVTKISARDLNALSPSGDI